MAMGVVIAASSLLTIAYFIGSIVYRRVMARGGIKGLPMKIGYYLYANTRVGLLVFRRELRKARSKLHGQPHSIVETLKQNGVAIHTLPYSSDNYGYAIVDEPNNITVLVDPADSESVQAFLVQNSIVPIAVLTTHKHWDHSGGNAELKRRYRALEIYGSSLEHVPATTHSVSDGDVLTFGRLQFTVRHTPGHTTGHVVYVLDGAAFNANDSLFSGDLLFVGGAGRLFEGDATAMLGSLDSICDMPDDMLVWPGHEYALTNLQFAASLEPENADVINKLRDVIERRTSRLSVSPTTLGAEKLYNPFLRTDDDSLLTALKLKTRTSSAELRHQLRVTALADCRARKDVFKPARK